MKAFQGAWESAPTLRPLGLKDVRVESINKDGVYIRMVRSALAYSLGNEFQYRVLDDARQMLEAKRPAAHLAGTAQFPSARDPRNRRCAGIERRLYTLGEIISPANPPLTNPNAPPRHL